VKLHNMQTKNKRAKDNQIKGFKSRFPGV
jgi:hypothetical protein